MTLLAIATRVAAEHLAVLGALHDGEETVVLLGPDEPGFWPHVQAGPEFADGAPDPLDRWSRRVIDGVAEEFEAATHYPFGTPVEPFMTWARRSGHAWASPVGLLVHDTAGLMVSYRGALRLSGRLVLPPAGTRPCETCAGKPCLTACPPRALTGNGYDLAACHAFLDSRPGVACMSGGCLVRRACPVGAEYRRLPEQSAYHMRQFHP